MPTPPVIVIEGHDFSFYESEEAVGRHLEPWYREEEHRAFEILDRAIERSGYT